MIISNLPIHTRLFFGKFAMLLLFALLPDCISDSGHDYDSLAALTSNIRLLKNCLLSHNRIYQSKMFNLQEVLVANWIQSTLAKISSHSRVLPLAQLKADWLGT